jgi:hypothetical protein
MNPYRPAGTWRLFPGGKEGDLKIRFENTEEITGTLAIKGEPAYPITGKWHSDSGDIQFTTTDTPTQSYTGALLYPQDERPLNVTYLLSGTYVDRSGAEHFWVAQLLVVP